MIRTRGRGRVHNVNHPRAAVRGYHHQEDAVRLTRDIRTPADLAQACEDAGAKLRRTKNQGWLVRGPRGSANIPQRWAHGSNQENIVQAVLAAGVCLDAVNADLVQKDEEATVAGGGPSPALMPAHVEPRPRPALVPDQRDDEPEPEEAEEPAARQEDVDALLDLVEILTGRVDVLTRRLDGLQKKVTGDTGPSPQDIARDIRERILAWFQTLPPGMRVPAGVIAGNLCPDDDTQATAYRRQITRLVELGQLVQHGGNPGGRGGGHAQYSLPTTQEDTDTTESAED